MVSNEDVLWNEGYERFPLEKDENHPWSPKHPFPRSI